MHPSSFTSSSKDIARFAAKVAAFLVLLVALDRAIGAAAEYLYFRTRDGDTGGQVNGLLAAKSDIVIFGSSRAESHYVPDVLEKSLGASTFNAGFKGSNSLYDYGIEQLLLKANRPRLIIYDFSSISVARTRSNPYDKLAPLHPYWRNAEIWALIEESGPLAPWHFLSRIYPYNSKFHSIAIFNVRRNRPGASNGFVPQHSRMAESPVGELRVREESYDGNLVAYAAKFISSAHEHGVKTIIVISPRHAAGTYPLPRELRMLADRLQVPVLDFDIAVYPQFTQAKLYRDETHLNVEGATVFSRLIAEYLSELADPRVPAREELPRQIPSGRT